MSSHVQNITVPWVPLAEFDWSFARSGPLPWNLTVWSILAVFTALPLWMTFELTVWIFYVFRRYTGLYFWSVLACTWGTTIHAIGFILKFCVPQCNWILATVLAEIGWVGMVTGFSVVLYSRLNLIVGGVHKSRILNLILAMIITDAFLFHVPTIVFQFAVSNKSTHKKFLPYMAPMERVQIMAFSTQEIIISAIYMYNTIKWLKTSFEKRTRNTIALLIWIQVIVILCDVIVITLDYCEYFTLKAVMHSFVYAFKLQLEFVILNDIKAMAQSGSLAVGNSSRTHAGSFGASPDSPSSTVKSPEKSWWSSRLTLLSRKGNDELQTANFGAHDMLTPNRGHHGHMDSITSEKTSQESSYRAQAMTYPNKVDSANGDFITIHPVSVTPSGGRSGGQDLERQYLGRQNREW
jgi:hypothetical protein